MYEVVVPSRCLAASSARRRFILAELLEPRRLLSYTFHALALLNSSQLSDPSQVMVEDAGGDLFFLATQGSAANEVEALCELGKGSSTPSVLTTFSYGNSTVDGLVIDSTGDLFGTVNNGGANSNGFVWELAAGSSTPTTLASFDYSTTGDAPSPGYDLVMDSSGNLYGTMQSGGAQNGGDVWELPKGSGTISVLASFSPSVTNNSVNGLVIDSSGNLYGTIGRDISVTGAHGAVWELPKGSSSVSVLASFDGANGDEPQTPLVVDSSGDVLGETNAGGSGPAGDVGAGTFFEIASGSGTITTLASFSGSGDEVSPSEGVVSDGKGDLFTVTSGISGSPGGVFELPAGSSTITEIEPYSGATTGTGARTLVADSSGDLFGMTSGGGTGGGVIFELTPGSSGGGGSTSSLSGTLSGKVPASAIIGQKLSVLQTLNIDNSGSSTVSGAVSVKLYLSTSTSVDSSSVQLTSASRNVKLRSHAHLLLPLRATSIPSTVSAGTYYLVAQITDPSGATTDAASSGTISIAPAQIDLSGSFVKTPVPTKTGRTVLTFNVSNGGNVSAVGNLDFNIDSSPDGLPSDATVLTSVTRRINLRADKSIRMTDALTLPAGTYFVAVDLDPSDAFEDLKLRNNFFATTASIIVP